MKHSHNITALLSQFEGCRLTAYHNEIDPSDVYTIGYGHTIGVYPGMTITKNQANIYLNADLTNAEYFVDKLVEVELTQNEFDALVDFVFNLGCARFQSSTLLKLINENNFSAAALEFDKWDYASGKVCAGLLKRRQMETDLFNAKN